MKNRKRKKRDKAKVSDNLGSGSGIVCPYLHMPSISSLMGRIQHQKCAFSQRAQKADLVFAGSITRSPLRKTPPDTLAPSRVVQRVHDILYTNRAILARVIGPRDRLDPVARLKGNALAIQPTRSARRTDTRPLRRSASPRGATTKVGVQARKLIPPSDRARLRPPVRSRRWREHRCKW